MLIKTKFTFVFISGLAALNRCMRCQNPQEKCFESCQLHRKGALLSRSCQDSPNTNAQVADRRCIEISYKREDTNDRLEKFFTLFDVAVYSNRIVT